MSDIRTILAAELQQMAQDFARRGPGLQAGSEESATECLELCQRLGQVATMIEAPALEEFALFLMANISGLLGQQEVDAPAQLCAALQACLNEGAQSARWSTIADDLAHERWSAALDPSAARELAANLQSLLDTAAETNRATAPLTMDDLTMVPGEDVGEETLQAFFHEAPLQASKLAQLFAQLADELDESTLIAAQRLAHTLKGSSALCGLPAISHLAHAMESAMQRLPTTSDAERKLCCAQLLEAGDLIEELIERAMRAEPAGPQVLTLIRALDDAVSGSPAVTTQTLPGSEDADVHLPHSATADIPPSAAAGQQPTLHVPVDVIDENLRRAGEVNVAIGQMATQLSDTLERAQRLTQQLALVQHQVYELETLVDTRVTPARLQRGDAGHFDPLEMDEYTALHGLSRAFAESTLDSRELSRELADDLLKLQNLIAQHARLGRELTESVMSARLVPVATIVPRLERIVRQVARQTGRQVDLQVSGRELSIDTDILNGLVEPLMHALRNAVDHGIEPCEARLAAGKPAAGLLRLSFRRTGNRIEVECVDDGRGLDYEAIAARARATGLLREGEARSHVELAAFVFAPGFSTRNQVTAVSGRGVGMDVVRASIERLKGTVHLDSRSGEGCTLTFRLPLSLSAAHVLFVSVGHAVYGLPSTTVDQVLYSDAGRVIALADGFAFDYGERISPLYSLGELLGTATRALSDLAEHPQPIVIVNGDTGPAALVVDRALDSRQVIIKGLSSLLPQIAGVAGASVLPNGGIGVILEIRELLRRPLEPIPLASAGNRIESSSAPRALVVDDSLSARRTLAQFLSDCGYEVDTAMDGLDAIGKLEQRGADIVLVDLEMPRMNGLELTAHLRARSAFENLPIVMITSRAADKHRTQALRTGVSAYLTKPYLEHELMACLDRCMETAP